ncbi:MAG: acetyl-CoA synthase subunit gamma, partial [Bacillota bacterium]|nr:acetyl-CoA synthase subunit gamma [Bacillota bacterium]
MDNNNCCNSDNKPVKKFKIKAVNPKAISSPASIKYAVTNNSCCCGNSSEPITKYDMKQKWIIGEISTAE